MQLSSISKYNSIPYSNSKSLSFCHKTYQSRMDEERNNYNKLSWSLYGKSKSKQRVLNTMENEIQSLKIQKSKDETEAKCIKEKTEKLTKNYNELISIKDKEIFVQKEINKNLEIIKKTKERRIQELKSHLEKLNKIQNTYFKESNNELIKQKTIREETEILDSLHKENFEKRKSALEQKFQLLINKKAELNCKILKLAKEKVNNSILEFDLYKTLSKKNDYRGYHSIKGYNAIKNKLSNMVGNPIVLEKNGENAIIPNGVILWGKRNPIKNKLVDAFANQFECNLINFEKSKRKNENLSILYNLMNECKKNYETTETRTILKINDFDKIFSHKNKPAMASLKDLMDDLSSNYKCTIFAVTNNIKKIDTILLRDGRFSVKIEVPADSKKFSNYIFNCILKVKKFLKYR